MDVGGTVLLGTVLADVGGTALLYCWGHGISACGCGRFSTVVLLGTWD